MAHCSLKIRLLGTIFFQKSEAHSLKVLSVQITYIEESAGTVTFSAAKL
jgi:hypothetical protein